MVDAGSGSGPALTPHAYGRLRVSFAPSLVRRPIIGSPDTGRPPHLDAGDDEGTGLVRSQRRPRRAAATIR